MAADSEDHEAGASQAGGAPDFSLTLAEALALDSDSARLTSGSPGMDFLLGGGYRGGAITEVYGASNTGKTQLALQASVMAAARGHSTVYIDTESSFRPERLSEIAQARGVDPSEVLPRVFCVEARTFAEELRAVARLAGASRAASAKLVVVDTVTKNLSLELPERQAIGRRQSLLAVYLNALARDAFTHGRSVLLLNRVTAAREGQAIHEVSVGGTTLRRFVERAIRLERQGREVVATLEDGRWDAGWAGGSKMVRCSLTRRGFE